MCVCVIVCVIGVLRRFQHSVSHITTVVTCCMRRDSARALIDTNTDAPCRRHKTTMYHPITLFWHRTNQSWLYPRNAECLARKQPAPMLAPLLWHGRGRTCDLPTTMRTLSALGHAAGLYMLTQVNMIYLLVKFNFNTTKEGWEWGWTKMLLPSSLYRQGLPWPSGLGVSLWNYLPLSAEVGLPWDTVVSW